MKTKVIFRIIDGEVIALFPEEPNSIQEPNTCMSYMHVGQHGGASIELCHTLKKATPEQYADLHKELTCSGYTLEVVNTVTKAMNKERMGAIQIFRECQAETKANFS